MNVRIPQTTSIETAIRLYYEKPELTNKDIVELFGKLANSTVARLKNKAREQMIEDNVPVWNPQRVNTKSAYIAWGIDVDDLEMRYEKLKQLEKIS